MEYFLETDIAKFEIRQEPLGMWDLWVNGMPTITFDSAQAAARSVRQGRSGFVGWDTLEENNAPEDISGWTKKE